MANFMAELINGEFHLPEPIIQHIQSFLNAKQAARTTILSKSWRKAWLTRPDLDFDESAFPSDRIFSEFSQNTFRRYEELNLKIASLRLFIKRGQLYDPWDFPNKLIVKALELGANHLSVANDDCPAHYLLPIVDVFRFENLVGLSLNRCKIYVGPDQSIIYSRLKSLRLSTLKIQSNLISDFIIPSCPLIEQLSLSCICVSKYSPINLHKLHKKLKHLQICYVEIDTLFLGDLSSTFPSLKSLTLTYPFLRLRQDILISSCSLEHINLSFRNDVSVSFDVPSIRKFTFEGSIFNSLCFKSPSREWESHVSIKFYKKFHTLSFRELNKFLLNLSPSKIYLSIYLPSSQTFDNLVNHLPRPQVENLTLDSNLSSSFSCCAPFDGLFRSCRPKFITLYLLPKSNFGHDYLCKTFVQRVNENRSIQSHRMYGLHDLEEINVRVFDEAVALWRDVPWETFLDASMSSENKQKVRFQLKWKS